MLATKKAARRPAPKSTRAGVKGKSKAAKSAPKAAGKGEAAPARMSKKEAAPAAAEAAAEAEVAVAEAPAPKKPERRRVTAEHMAEKQREISISEFFTKNRHLLGFDNASRALLTS